MAHRNISDIQADIDAVQAVISKRITTDILSYTINGRQITKTDPAQLFKIKGLLQEELNQAKTARNLAAGLGNPNKILTRF